MIAAALWCERNPSGDGALRAPGILEQPEQMYLLHLLPTADSERETG